MPVFHVTVKEIWDHTYEVEALSVEEAIQKVHRNDLDVESLDETFEFRDRLNNETWNVEQV